MTVILNETKSVKLMTVILNETESVKIMTVILNVKLNSVKLITDP